jgi:hypothetical protein
MNNWINIHTAPNMVEAHLIRGKLESENIPTMLKYESVGQIYGITVDGLSEVQIFVPKELQKEAAQLIMNNEAQDLGGETLSDN